MDYEQVMALPRPRHKLPRKPGMSRLYNYVNFDKFETLPVIGTNGQPYAVRKQGAGLANLMNAINTTAYITTYDANGKAMDKTKLELGDDPDRNGVYTFSFTLNNFGTQGQIYSLTGDFFTQDMVTIDGVDYTAKTTTPLSMGVDYVIEGGYINTSEKYSCDLNGDGVTDAEDAQIILNIKCSEDSEDQSIGD